MEITPFIWPFVISMVNSFQLDAEASYTVLGFVHKQTPEEPKAAGLATPPDFFSSIRSTLFRAAVVIREGTLF